MVERKAASLAAMMVLGLVVWTGLKMAAYWVDS